MPIDGKTMRGSYTKADKSDMLHIVSAWASVQGITLGQVAVDSKSNEITAIPQLLEMLELHGAIVSIDAMGCQRAKILIEMGASKIISGGGDYVLQVKGNQSTLQEAIASSFAEADTAEATQSKARQRTTKEKFRGRQETRHYTIMPLPDTMSAIGKKWPGLRSIGRVVREVQRDGKQTCETSYYITSLEAKVGVFSESVRSHWGIENSLHECFVIAISKSCQSTR